MEIFVFDVVELLFVGGDALEPAERGDHGEEEVEFRVFGDLGLEEDYGFLRVEAGGEIVDGDLEGIFCDGGSVGVIAGEGVPVGDEIETLVGGIGLELDPVLESAEIVTDVKTAGGAHAGEDSFRGGGQFVRASVNGMMMLERKGYQISAIG